MELLQRFSKIGIMSLLLLTLFSNYSSAQGVAYPAPQYLSAYMNYDEFGNMLAISWTMNIGNNQTQPTKFFVYLSDTCSNDMSDFVKFAELGADTLEYYKDQYFVLLPINNVFGCRSVYVTAVYGANESGPSNIEYFQVYNPHYAYFVSNPPMTAQKQQVYTYQMEAHSSMLSDLITISPVLMPQNANFDATTNTLTWTPTQSGMFNFSFKAVGSPSGAEGYHDWYVIVPECDIPAKLDGYVRDQNNDLVPHGWVFLQRHFFDSLVRVQGLMPPMFFEAEILNGFYSFNNLDSGTYSIYVSSPNFIHDGDNQAEIIQIACGQKLQKDLTVIEQKYYYVSIISQPETHAKLNTLYSYQVEAQVMSGDKFDPIDEEVELAYEIMYGPANAQIDEETGLITWTPTANGYYNFQVRAYIPGNDFAQDIQYWDVYVNECEVPGTINLNVSYDDGEPVPFGNAVLITGNISQVVDSTNFPRVYYAQLENGIAKFENLDNGEYYLFVKLYDDFMVGNEVWYENASSFEEATKITLQCSDTLNLTMEVEAPAPPENKTVSGTVYRQKTGEVVPFTLVELIPIYIKGPQFNSTLLQTITDAYGNYTITAPNNAVYVARASFDPYSVPLVGAPVLLPQYYDQVGHFAEATPIDLYDDIDGIDFYMKEVPVYTNSINGTINDENGYPLESAYVIAFRLGNNPNNPEDNWYGHSALTNAQGSYTISNLTPGDYIIFAVSNKRADCTQGYYKAGEDYTWNWEDATVITVSDNSLVTGINMQLSKNKKFVGNGKIIGFVGNKKGKTVIKGEDASNPINGANVYASDELGNIFMGTFTSQSGEFAINNLPNGKYSVFAEKVGFKGTVMNVEITSENPVVSTNVPLEEKEQTTSVDETPINNAILFPNPVSENFNIAFSGTHGYADVVISNVLGEAVIKRTFNVETGLNTLTMNVNQLSKGTYFIKITNNNQTISLPFVINK